ncbi:hypothetical protein [Gelidibacter mesophilus]|uniref:hypothetical protein n=1 Tax=Gelidibacter mesophilus TaxID=169050 RepID=UPI0012FAED0F|nr:hypothetical protein [Gelidibacter mesophilus]
MTNEVNASYFQPHFPDAKPHQVQVVSFEMCHLQTANPEKYLSKYVRCTKLMIRIKIIENRSYCEKVENN